MARITCHHPAHLTGHIGPVRFVGGVGETEDADLLAFFAGQPELYTVEDNETPKARRSRGGKPEDTTDQE
jgi:hypothetical protein